MHAKHLIVFDSLRRSIGPIVANTWCPIMFYTQKWKILRIFITIKLKTIKLIYSGESVPLLRFKPIFKKLQMTKIACVG